MKRTISIIVLSVITLFPAFSATVSGTVELQEKTMTGYETANAINDVVLFLQPMDDAAVSAVKKIEPVVEWLNQRNKEFIPHVIIVQKEGKVRFGNADPWFHNIYSRDPKFDLGRYPKGFFKEQQYTETGLYHVFCDIHPNMHGIIAVVDTPFYAYRKENIEDEKRFKFTPDGAFSIFNVPPGKYRLTAWQERSEFVHLEVTVSGADITGLTIEIKETKRKTTDQRQDANPYGRSLLRKTQ